LRGSARSPTLRAMDIVRYVSPKHMVKACAAPRRDLKTIVICLWISTALLAWIPSVIGLVVGIVTRFEIGSKYGSEYGLNNWYELAFPFCTQTVNFAIVTYAIIIVFRGVDDVMTALADFTCVLVPASIITTVVAYVLPPLIDPVVDRLGLNFGRISEPWKGIFMQAVAFAFNVLLQFCLYYIAIRMIGSIRRTRREYAKARASLGGSANPTVPTQ
jgi:large-conductance mechanosensitive channel